MNLYRNFGYMLENWVTDGYPEASCYSSEEASEKHQDASSSDSASACSIRFAGTTLRSASEDSGVDLSNVGSPLASRSSVLTSEDSLTLKQAAVCETEEHAQSPSLSSSSSSCFSEAQGSQNLSTTADRPSVEPEAEALRRNEPDWTQATERESSISDAAPRRRCNTTSLTRGLHTATTRTPHRTGSVGSRRPHTQPADQDRPTHAVEQIAGDNGGPVEDADPNWDGFSPGLQYLERMCRMLEEIARLQQQNQSLQVQMDTIRILETASTQKPETSSTFNKKPKALHPEDQSAPSAHGFRRRTASDTWAFLKHRRKAKAEQLHASTDVLVEEPDDNLEPPLETEQKKTSSSLKQRISSLRKNEKPNHSRSSSLYGEKSMLRLFRNRRKTTRL